MRAKFFIFSTCLVAIFSFGFGNQNPHTGAVKNIEGISVKLIRKRTVIFIFLLIGVVFATSCDESSTPPEDDTPPEIPLDGRGGGIIAFSITPPNINNEIYAFKSLRIFNLIEEDL